MVLESGNQPHKLPSLLPLEAAYLTNLGRPKMVVPQVRQHYRKK